MHAPNDTGRFPGFISYTVSWYLIYSPGTLALVEIQLYITLSHTPPQYNVGRS